MRLLIPPSLPCAEHVAILVPCCFNGKATHLVLVDTTYHLSGCHLWGLCCQQVLGETEEEERGCTTVQLLRSAI